MASTGAAISAWHPKTESDKEFVRSQLERLVSDARFVSSKRYPCLLRYVVEETLADNEANLKERIIGMEAFHRPPDYDTNLDPIVRLCAAEVRKRLAQYYQSPAHEGELRIELNPGSYVPIFSQPAADAPVLVPIPLDVPAETAPVSLPTTMTRAFRPAIFLAFGAIIAAMLTFAAGFWWHSEEQKSALQEIWSPLLTSGKPILFCVGETEQFDPDDSRLTELQSGADGDSFLQPLANKIDLVPFSDLQVLSNFVSLVGARGHAFRVQNVRNTVSSQLRDGPVVLIGALNNDWTLNRTSSLRFHFEGPEGPDRVFWIADTHHPESRAWQVSGTAPRSQVVKDYAIAARFIDQSSGQLVLVAAGITGSGTRAAGEFLTDDADLKQLAESAGAASNKRNFEIVLSSQVVNGMQGQPRVEATAFW